MLMEGFLNAIANFGFPIVIAGYLLVRMEKTLMTLSKNVRDLKEVVGNVCEQLERNNK